MIQLSSLKLTKHMNNYSSKAKPNIIVAKQKKVMRGCNEKKVKWDEHT